MNDLSTVFVFISSVLDGWKVSSTASITFRPRRKSSGKWRILPQIVTSKPRKSSKHRRFTPKFFFSLDNFSIRIFPGEINWNLYFIREPAWRKERWPVKIWFTRISLNLCSTVHRWNRVYDRVQRLVTESKSTCFHRTVSYRCLIAWSRLNRASKLSFYWIANRWSQFACCFILLLVAGEITSENRQVDTEKNVTKLKLLPDTGGVANFQWMLPASTFGISHNENGKWQMF